MLHTNKKSRLPSNKGRPPFLTVVHASCFVYDYGQKGRDIVDVTLTVVNVTSPYISFLYGYKKTQINKATYL